MLKINIEGDDPTVYAVLAVLGAHAAATLSGVMPSTPVNQGGAGMGAEWLKGRGVNADAVIKGDKSEWLKGRGVNTDAVIKGRKIAQDLVQQWVVDWDLPADQQPNRAELLPALSRSGPTMKALSAYLNEVKNPWVAAGATPEQASHIAQVGSALQLFPSPDPVIPLD